MWAKKPYSLSSDIWALGCVTLELCTLRRAFDGQTEAEVQRAVERMQPPMTPARYSDELDGIIRRMLDPNPIERPTATEVGVCGEMCEVDGSVFFCAKPPLK